MNAYIVEAKRTAMGRAHAERGIFKNIRADVLLSHLISTLSTLVPKEAIDDVYIGCVGQHLEQGKNIARLASLLAGLPPTVPGVTINRLCGSSLQAFNFAATALHMQEAHVLLAGGVEHMHHVPMTAALDYNPTLLSQYEFPFTQMGLTAEKVADTYGISRKEQDEFSILSHQKALEARDLGYFKKEIHPIFDGTERIDQDQGPRADTTLEALSQLKPVFKENGTVTAANSSPLSDGASLTLLASEEGCKKFSLTKKAEILDFAVVGVNPCMMGMGPVPATEKVLKKNNLTFSDIDVVEMNEAFASQAIACIRALKIPIEKINPFGGAIALGHPLGATGTRLVTTLLHGLEQKDGELGLATMCIGHGQGIATLLKRL